MNSNAQFTVMGPGPGSIPSSIYAPPPLLPTSDKLQWRRRIRLWGETLRRMSKGGDSKAKSAFNAMGLTIYQSMDDTCAGKLDSAIECGILHLDPDENDETDPMDIREKIIDLVAKDSVTETIRRLVSMLKEIYVCKRKQNESTDIFANRFQGLALRYLNHCNPISSKQESQNFAMLILENANIPAQVYSSIITKLVSKANERSGDEDNVMLVAREQLKKLDEDTKGLQEAYQKLRNAENPVVDSEGNEDIMQVLSRMQQNLRNTWKANKERHTKDRSNVRITVEDAVDALREVKIELNLQNKDIDNICKNGALLGKRSFGNMNEGNQPYKKMEEGTHRKKVHIPAGEGPKATSRCRNCKKIGHWWKDPECIYNKVRSAIEEKEARNQQPDINEIVQQISTPANIGQETSTPRKKVSFFQ